MELEALPKQTGEFVEPSEKNEDANWAELFRSAGLDLDKFTPTSPRLVSRTPTTTSKAWLGAYPETGMRIRVEASQFAGKPVAFLIHEFRELGPTSDELHRNPRYIQRVTTWRFGALVILILIAAGMAWDSLARGRGDQRGATYLGLATFGLVIAFTLLTGNHNGHLLGFGHLLMQGMGHGLAVGALLAIYYLAVEPHVRRAWPETIISWSRLLHGRFRDSLVGLHVLIGLAIGVGGALFHIERHHVARWLNATEGPPLMNMATSLESLLGPISTAGTVLEIVVDLSRESMKCVMALVIFRLILRSKLAAALAVVAVFTLVWTQTVRGDGLWSILGMIGTAAVVASFTYALVRFGVVAMIVAVVMQGVLTELPMSLDPNDWYAGSTLLSLLLVAGISIYGYRTSTRFSTWSKKKR